LGDILFSSGSKKTAIYGCAKPAQPYTIKEFVHGELMPRAQMGKIAIFILRKEREWGLPQHTNVIASPSQNGYITKRARDVIINILNSGGLT
jgi:hypothetical protein